MHFTSSLRRPPLSGNVKAASLVDLIRTANARTLRAATGIVLSVMFGLPVSLSSAPLSKPASN